VSNEKEWMRLYVQTGDKVAFEAIFTEFAPRIHRYILRRTRGNRNLADDLTQQTFLHLHRARNDFDLSRSLRPWIFTIAANLVREAARKSMRRPETLVDPLERSTDAVAPAVSSPEDRLVRRTLDTLPQAQREVIVLHWFEGLSFSEISTVVGASLSAVKVRAHRGYKQLRENLGGSL
jgi:RNA polymerase sigma factor (sigma-70 family)